MTELSGAQRQVLIALWRGGDDIRVRVGTLKALHRRGLVIPVLVCRFVTTWPGGVPADPEDDLAGAVDGGRHLEWRWWSGWLTLAGRVEAARLADETAANGREL
jgi:hypothetical protein